MANRVNSRLRIGACLLGLFSFVFATAQTPLLISLSRFKELYIRLRIRQELQKFKFGSNLIYSLTQTRKQFLRLQKK
jgi:hypothetical protein